MFNADAVLQPRKANQPWEGANRLTSSVSQWPLLPTATPGIPRPGAGAGTEAQAPTDRHRLLRRNLQAQATQQARSQAIRVVATSTCHHDHPNPPFIINSLLFNPLALRHISTVSL
jgi:hypothetical protein